MGSYLCKAVDPQGRRQTLVREAPGPDVILADLNRQGWTVLELTPHQDRGTSLGGPRLSKSLVLDFTRTMNLLLSSGLGVKEAFKVAKDIFDRDDSRQFLASVTGDLEKGHSLFQALSPYRSSLGALYLGLIRIGEKTGSLAPLFARLTEYLTVQKQVSDKLVNALIYPSLVLSVAFIGIIFLLVFIFPALNELVGSLKPGSDTGLQNNITGTAQTLVTTLVLLLLGAGMVLVLLFQSKKNRVLGQKLALGVWKLPLIGTHFQLLDVLNFSFAMETLLQAGYSAEVSLEEAAGTVKNSWFQEELRQVKELVVQGKNLSKALDRPYMPKRLVTWVKVGEESGDLKAVFTQLRFYYQEDLDKTLTRLMGLMEPVLILGVGVILILLIVNFIAPVFSMMGDLL